MNLEQRIKAFSALGNHLQQMSSEAFESLAESARMENPWFTNDNIKKSLEGITRFLSKEVLTEWTSRYTLNPNQPKTVALVMAGNIPLVGFHDLLCVLISGHQAQIKLSSKDSKLLTYLMKHLVWLEPEFETHITIKETKIENFDAVIATGGDNSARYFHEYFGKYAHIIRKNRTSVAILNGFETKEELEIL
jgi:NAD kinase